MTLWLWACYTRLSRNQVHDYALIDYCDEGQIWDPVRSAYFYRLDPHTFTINPLARPNEPSLSPPSSNLTSFFYYTGNWGDTQYPDSDPRQETVPYFGIKRFETGPNGPRYKHLIRKGLMRDTERRQSWLEWAVGIYMSLYPCCLRGWRAWVFVGLFVSLLSCSVIGVIVVVRRWRNRKNAYERVGPEDVPLEDFLLEEQGLLSASDDSSNDTRNRE